MVIPNKEDLRLLAQYQGTFCLSFYLPTSRSGKETLNNPTRLKNLLRTARGRLLEFGMDKTQMENFLHPVTSLLNDYEFWQHQNEGLAIFLNPSTFKFYQMNYPPQEYVEVANAFHLKPIIHMIVENHSFYILSLSQKSVAFYRANNFAIEKINLEGLPQSLDDLGSFEKGTHNISMHSAGNGNKSFSHAHPMEKEDPKIRIFQYFQLIDKALHHFLKEDKLPLLLAGVEYYFPLYREANTYHHLSTEIITGNPELISMENLRKNGMEKLQPFFNQGKEHALELINSALNKGQAHSVIEKVVIAAFQGRVQICIVALEEKRWGLFDEATQRVQLAPGNIRGPRDLLDFAAVQTLVHGGQVFSVPAEEIPGNSVVAALMRY